MALTRAQYLQGDSGQGNVLLGQVQGVKQGPGTLITADGTISVDASTAVGLVKLNNPAAFNLYSWPATSGTATTFLMSDGAGNLSWQSPRIGSVSAVSSVPPASAQVGQLWYDANERILKVYENVDNNASPVWTPVSRGVDPSAEVVSSIPPFQGTGDGSPQSPFLARDLSILPGYLVRSEETITVTGLAPYQYVPITDLNSDLNGNRFSASSYFSDGEGNLTFRLIFSDFPVSSSGITYSADLEVGFNSFRIRSSVAILQPLALQSAGTISGNARVGESLTFSPGMAMGGKAPYTYSWAWKLASSGNIIQTNGTTLVVPDQAVGDRIIVELTATDSNNNFVTGNTAGYPTSPAQIERGQFPFTQIKFPTALFQSIATQWLDTSQELYADGCIEISLDGSNWSQGPYTISNGGTVYTRWASSPSCSGAPNGSVLVGCVFSDSYKECGSFTIDKIPSPFSFIPNSNVQIGATTVSNAITPVGYNAGAFVTYSGDSTLTAIQGSLDNGSSWTDIPIAGVDTFAINPGQSLRVRGVVGSQPLRVYTADINIGSGSSTQSAKFTATTSDTTTFTTQIRFPTSTSEGYGSIPGAASDGWSATDGTVSLWASDCVEIRVENSSGGLISDYNAAYPRTVNPTNVIRTRWKTSGGSSGCASATEGVVISGSIHNAATIPLSNRINTGSMTIDRVPGQFTFNNLSGQAVSTQVSSNSISLSGFNSTVYLTATSPVVNPLTSVQASVNGGPWTAVPSSGTSFPIEPVPAGSGQTPPTLSIRGTTGSSTSTGYSVAINVGDGGSSFSSASWTVTTTAAVPTVTAPRINSPVNGASSINPYTANPAGVNVAASAYVAINGASATQLNAVWEVRSGSTTGTVIYTETETANFQSWFIPLIVNNNQILAPNTTYYVRVRYTSADVNPVVSEWSPFSSFTTNPVFSQNWALRFTNSSWGYASDLLANDGSRWLAIGIKDIGSREGNFNYGVTTSTDGINWSNTGEFSAAAMNAVAYGNNVWLVVGSGQSRRSSNNGTSWSTPSNNGITSQTLWSLAFGAGVFVAVGDSGVIQTTVDGTNWTSRASGVNSTISHVIYADNQFVAVGNGFVLVSPTGTTWTRYNSPVISSWTGVLRVAYLNTGTPTYMIVSRGSRTESPYLSKTALRSTNLTSWQTVNLPDFSIDLAAGAGTFTLISSTGYSYLLSQSILNYYFRGYIRVYASPTGNDGTWVEQTFPYYYGPNSNFWGYNYWYYYYDYGWPYYYNFAGWNLEYGTTGNGIGRFVAMNFGGEIFSTS